MKKKLFVSVGEETEIEVTVLDDNGHALAVAYGGYCGGRTADEPSDWPNIELFEYKAHEAAVEAVKSVAVEMILRGRPFAPAHIINHCDLDPKTMEAFRNVFLDAGFVVDDEANDPDCLVFKFTM